MRFVKYLLVGLLFFYIQILFAPKLVVLGVAPFLILPFIIFAGLNLNLMQTSTISFIIGIALDLLNPYLLGSHCIVLLIIALIIHNYHGMIKKDKPAPVLISLLILNLIYLVPILLIKFLVFGYDSLWLQLFIPELLYNTIISMVILLILVVTQKLKIVIAD